MCILSRCATVLDIWWKTERASFLFARIGGDRPAQPEMRHARLFAALRLKKHRLNVGNVRFQLLYRGIG